MSTMRDTEYMRKALTLAKKGMGRTSPNPCVGAVIVKGNRIIGQGYHKKAGTNHAEINALENSTESVKGATVYVTLEPCNHTGRTSPCSHALVKAGISRVVVGMEDPNPLVHGTGIDYLQMHGVDVAAGVLEQECININLPFIKHIQTGLPFMVMKAGMSLDGKLNYCRGNSGWITGPESLRSTHRLRDRYDVIMVGSRTAIIDNPSLTTRLSGRNGRDPVRVVVDSQLSVPPESKVYSSDAGAYGWVFCAENADNRKIEELRDKGVKVTKVTSIGSGLDLKLICKKIGEAGLLSVLVEGGACLHGTLLKQEIYDYACLFQAPIFAGDAGVSLVSGMIVEGRDTAPRIREPKYRRLGEDILIEGKVVYPS